jgi:hypothetical protein
MRKRKERRGEVRSIVVERARKRAEAVGAARRAVGRGRELARGGSMSYAIALVLCLADSGALSSA